MAWRRPSNVSGYLLAGGKSSRMGTDKALLELAGKPLALHAVVKLRRVCMDVCILGDRKDLDAFAPLVPDLHEDCGPLGGIEAAFQHTEKVYSQRNWNLFLPVDMPFLPSAFLDYWVRGMVADESRGRRVGMFTVDGRPQPGLCMLHREVAPFVEAAIRDGSYKLFPVLDAAARQLAVRQGVTTEEVFFNMSWDEKSEYPRFPERVEDSEWWVPTPAQMEAKKMWFANLNTPKEFIDAERHLDALDT